MLVIPAIQEANVGEIQPWDQPRPFNETQAKKKKRQAWLALGCRGPPIQLPVHEQTPKKTCSASLSNF